MIRYIHEVGVKKILGNNTQKSINLLNLKIDKLDFIKIKNICFWKDTIKKMKKQAADWEKIFTNIIQHSDDQGLTL